MQLGLLLSTKPHNALLNYAPNNNRLLLDVAVRIDFFMLKKRAVDVLFMAFVMVAASTMLLIPFLLYGLDLQASGWSASNVALFGACIASTDAAAVSAILSSGDIMGLCQVKVHYTSIDLHLACRPFQAGPQRSSL